MFKKWTALLLAAVLVLCLAGCGEKKDEKPDTVTAVTGGQAAEPAPAAAPDRDAELKAAFDACSGEDAAMHFYAEPAAGPDISGMEILCAVSAKEEMEEKGYTVRGESELNGKKLLSLGTGAEAGLTEIFITDISPDGSMMFGIAGTSSAPLRAFVTEGRVILCTWSEERSAPDINGNFARYAGNKACAMASAAGTEGVIWSPDGRFAVLADTARALRNNNYRSALLVIADVMSGEYFMPVATETNPGRDSVFFTVPMGACFDETGSRVYFILTGYGLYEYDTAEGITRLIGMPPENLLGRENGPFLSLLPDGRLAYAMYGSTGQNGIGVYTPSAGQTALLLTAADFPDFAGISECTGRFTFEQVASGLEQSCSNLRFSENSGFGLTFFITYDGKPVRIGVIDANSGFAGAGDMYYMTPGRELKKFDSTAWETGNAADYSVSINNAVLSPGGRFALLAVSDRKAKEEAFYICELETLKTVRAELPADTGRIMNYVSYGSGTGYARGITWAEGNRFITPAGIFELKWGE